MRKFIVIVLVGFLLLAPTAVVTARQNWAEISRTLSEIQVTLGNISSLVSQGALDGDKMSLAELVQRSGIPADIALATGALLEVDSAEFKSEAEVDVKLTANRTSSNLSLNLGLDGAFDSKKSESAFDLSVSTKVDSNFTETLLADTDWRDMMEVSDFELAISTIFADDNFYLKILRGGNLGLIDLSEYRDEWIAFEDSLAESYGFDESVGEIEEVIANKERRDQEMRHFLRAHARHPIFEFTKLSDSRIDGQWYTTYRIDLATENLIDFEEARKEIAGSGYTPLSLEERREAEKMLENLSVSGTLAFDSSSSEIKKIGTDITFGASIDELGGMVSNPEAVNPYGIYNSNLERVDVSITSDIELSNINGNIDVAAPRNSTPFEDIADEIFDAVFMSIPQDED